MEPPLIISFPRVPLPGMLEYATLVCRDVCGVWLLVQLSHHLHTSRLYTTKPQKWGDFCWINRLMNVVHYQQQELAQCTPLQYCYAGGLYGTLHWENWQECLVRWENLQLLYCSLAKAIPLYGLQKHQLINIFTDHGTRVEVSDQAMGWRWIAKHYSLPFNTANPPHFWGLSVFYLPVCRLQGMTLAPVR